MIHAKRILFLALSFFILLCLSVPSWAGRIPLTNGNQVGNPTPVISTPTPTLPAYLIPTPTPSATPAPEPFANPFGGTLHAYVVREGDTILDVALEVGLDLEDVYCLVSPTFDRAQPLIVGSWLWVPDYPFACHRVQHGETLETLATSYSTEWLVIVGEEWNGLTDVRDGKNKLVAGTYLRVPLAADAGPVPVDDQGFLPLMLSQPIGTSPALVRVVSPAMAETGLPAVGGPGALYDAPVPADWPYGSGVFAWPMYGWLTQDYGPDHRAIDIAAPAGTMVSAADRGVVIRAGWNSQGYGLFVIVDHNIDYLTLYSHLSEVLVTEGQIVAKGEALGRVGSTGNSTGSHLHFEIRDFGRRTDPIPLFTD